MKKIFYCFLLLTFFVLSCSKEEADMDGSQNKETENKEIKIILEAENKFSKHICSYCILPIF